MRVAIDFFSFFKEGLGQLCDTREDSSETPRKAQSLGDYGFGVVRDGEQRVRDGVGEYNEEAGSVTQKQDVQTDPSATFTCVVGMEKFETMAYDDGIRVIVCVPSVCNKEDEDTVTIKKVHNSICLVVE